MPIKIVNSERLEEVSIKQVADVPRGDHAAVFGAFTCVDCDKGMHAKTKTEGGRARHFAHDADEDLERCALRDPDRVTHLNAIGALAIALRAGIARGVTIELPSTCCMCAQATPYRIYESQPGDTIVIDRRTVATRRPDLTVVRGGKVVLVVEVCQTHAVDDAKYMELLRHDKRVWEIRARDAETAAKAIASGGPAACPSMSTEKTVCGACARASHAAFRRLRSEIYEPIRTGIDVVTTCACCCKPAVVRVKCDHAQDEKELDTRLNAIMFYGEDGPEYLGIVTTSTGDRESRLQARVMLDEWRSEFLLDVPFHQVDEYLAWLGDRSRPLPRPATLYAWPEPLCRSCDEIYGRRTILTIRSDVRHDDGRRVEWELRVVEGQARAPEYNVYSRGSRRQIRADSAAAAVEQARKIYKQDAEATRRDDPTIVAIDIVTRAYGPAEPWGTRETKFNWDGAAKQWVGIPKKPQEQVDA